MLKEIRYMEVFDLSSGILLTRMDLPTIPLQTLKELWRNEIDQARQTQRVDDSDWDENMWDGVYLIQTEEQAAFFEKLLEIRFDLDKFCYYLASELWAETT